MDIRTLGKMLKENFGIIDADNIDFFWHKHEWKFERFVRNYPFLSSRCIEFNEWLSLYNNIDLI